MDMLHAVWSTVYRVARCRLCNTRRCHFSSFFFGGGGVVVLFRLPRNRCFHSAASFRPTRPSVFSTVSMSNVAPVWTALELSPHYAVANALVCNAPPSLSLSLSLVCVWGARAFVRLCVVCVCVRACARARVRGCVCVRRAYVVLRVHV